MSPTRRSAIAAAFLAGILPKAAPAQERQRFLLVTGAAGGAFNEYGPALARVVAPRAPIDLDVQATAGSNENIRAVSTGDADLGLINLGPAYDAWENRHAFRSGGGSYRNLRALFPMYETPFSLVALRASGIASLAELEGRTVGVGPAGGPSQLFFAGLAKVLQLTTRIVTGSPADQARRLLAGEVDAFWFGAGLPVAAFVEVLEKADARVLGLGEAEIAAFRAAFPYVSPFEIPAGIYKGQDVPLRTAAVWNFVVASDRMPEEPAYLLTRAALDGSAELAAELPVAAGTAAANVAADTFMPLHPGAVRYYREKGIALPSVLTSAG